MMCAVMGLVGFSPLVAGEVTTIIKGPQGPRASAMTWTFEPSEYGIWTAQLDNHGLRSLVIDVYDNTSGALELKLHQRIRFAAYDAYPAGVIYSEPVMMAPGSYEITGTPNGPRDSYVVVTDMFDLPPPLTASFTYSVAGPVLSVDASSSTGAISEYVWDWADGTMGSGMTASHEYAMPGTYSVVLTVLDSMGGSAAASEDVTLVNNLPVAAFSATLSGHTVSVDASASTDDWSITNYAWDFGDGSIGAGMMEDHTYTTPGTYPIVLTVTDAGSLQDTATENVVLPDMPPTAAFIVGVDGATVHVDASGSTDDWGIQSYSWAWGDGTTGTGVTASHTYVFPAAAPASVQTNGVIITAEPPPYYVAGYTYGPGDIILPNCPVTITNLRTGLSAETISSATGLYRYNLNLISDPLALSGDTINVTATLGTMIGWNETAIPSPMGSYLTMHVSLSEPVVEETWVTITLTVTDTGGNTATIALTVQIYP